MLIGRGKNRLVKVLQNFKFTRVVTGKKSKKKLIKIDNKNPKKIRRKKSEQKIWKNNPKIKM
jgi:hypothetical protein